MNLVLSGPIDEAFMDAVANLAKPRSVVGLHARAARLVDVDHSVGVRRDVLTLCDSGRVDHAYIEEGKRFADFKLLAMDMDSTLITIECIDEIADFAGKKAEVAAITEAAMRGEIPDFAESLRRRVALLKGTPATVLEQVFHERLRLSAGATELLDAAKSNGISTILLSGGFTYFADRLKDELQLDAACANSLQIEDGVLTGLVIDPILDAIGKKRHVEQKMTALRCNEEQLLVVGDGANDIPMMGLCANSIAFHAKTSVNKVARHRVKYGALTTVLDYFPARTDSPQARFLDPNGTQFALFKGLPHDRNAAAVSDDQR